MKAPELQRCTAGAFVRLAQKRSRQPKLRRLCRTDVDENVAVYGHRGMMGDVARGTSVALGLVLASTPSVAATSPCTAYLASRTPT